MSGADEMSRAHRWAAVPPVAVLSRGFRLDIASGDKPLSYSEKGVFFMSAQALNDSSALSVNATEAAAQASAANSAPQVKNGVRGDFTLGP